MKDLTSSAGRPTYSAPQLTVFGAMTELTAAGGSQSCEVGLERAGTSRNCRPDGSGRTPFTSGIRNKP